MSVVPPRRRNVFSSRNRSSFAWNVGTVSATSSRKTVPSSACSKSPRFCWRASVNAPRSCPNSSDSSRVSGRAEQVMFMKGRAARLPPKWTTFASRSLPVPLSPVSSTVDVGLSATLARQCLETLHDVGLADDRVERKWSRQILLQPAQLAAAARGFHGPCHPQHDFIDLEGLGEVVGGAGFHGFDDELGVLVSGQHDHREIGIDGDAVSGAPRCRRRRAVCSRGSPHPERAH